MDSYLLQHFVQVVSPLAVLELFMSLQLLFLNLFLSLDPLVFSKYRSTHHDPLHYCTPYQVKSTLNFRNNSTSFQIFHLIHLNFS